MKKQIEIRIFSDGKIQTLTRNVKGKNCLKYIVPLETILEAKVIDSDFLSEYYEQEINENENQSYELNIEN